jgi:hypothetical protein
LLEASTRRRRPACCASLPHGLHVYGSAGASRQSEREQGSMPPDLHSAPPPRVPCFVGHHEQARVEQPRAWASSALSTMAAASLRPGSPHKGDEGRRQFFFSAVRSPRHIFSFSASCSSAQLARPAAGNEIWGNS